MDCSTNISTFDNDPYYPWVYQPHNGTIFYCNGSYSLDYQCNATTPADTDIAGPGVIVSFILTAWTTVFVAMIPAFYELLEFLSNAQDWSLSSILTTASPAGEGDPPVIMRYESGSRSSGHLRRAAQLRRILYFNSTTDHIRETAKTLLRSLCDLQIVTGLAIVVAGLAQLPEISFYHQQLAVKYWYLTLNSFWAARVEYMEIDKPIEYNGRTTIRWVGVLTSMVTGTVFQCIVNVREDLDWVIFEEGRCYRSHDQSTNWIWVAGASLYAGSLLLQILPVTRPIVREYLEFERVSLRALGKQWTRAGTEVLANLHHPVINSWLDMMGMIARVVPRSVVFLGLSVATLLCWLLSQFVSAWSYGAGFQPLLILVYVAFAAWNTFDIVDLKLSNRSLIEGPEAIWGFGQVLPVVLCATIALNAADAFKCKYPYPNNPLSLH